MSSAEWTGRAAIIESGRHPAEYIAQQLTDFKTGARHPSVGDTSMAKIARALTAEETKATLTYYSRLPRTSWIAVVETATVPQTRVVDSNLRIPIEGTDMEPLGQRIVEVPKFSARTRRRDWHAPFIAYVPLGSVRRGRAFVSSGGARRIGATRFPKASGCSRSACARPRSLTVPGVGKISTGPE
jgi:hypothetical protein